MVGPRSLGPAILFHLKWLQKEPTHPSGRKPGRLATTEGASEAWPRQTAAAWLRGRSCLRNPCQAGLLWGESSAGKPRPPSTCRGWGWGGVRRTGHPSAASPSPQLSGRLFIAVHSLPFLHWAPGLLLQEVPLGSPKHSVAPQMLPRKCPPLPFLSGFRQSSWVWWASRGQLLTGSCLSGDEALVWMLP